MLRFADRHADRRLARRNIAEKFAQPTNGERESGARTVEWEGWRVILYIMNSGAARRTNGCIT